MIVLYHLENPINTTANILININPTFSSIKVDQSISPFFLSNIYKQKEVIPAICPEGNPGASFLAGPFGKIISIICSLRPSSYFPHKFG